MGGEGRQKERRRNKEKEEEEQSGDSRKISPKKPLLVGCTNQGKSLEKLFLSFFPVKRNQNRKKRKKK